MRIVVGAFCALAAAFALRVVETPVSAAAQPSCDFLTGGGFIYPTGTPAGGEGTFAAGGGCKQGSGTGTPPVPFFGHMEYVDHGIDLNIHGITITGYMVDSAVFANPDARLICGTATTDQGDVTFIVRVKDGGEPGLDKDEFDIELQGTVVYSTFGVAPHKLAGGNIQLHKQHKTNTAVFGGSCPALSSSSSADVTVTKSTTTPTVEPGGGRKVGYDLVVRNTGSATATNVVVMDSLPIATSVTSWTINPAVTECSIALDNTLTCNFATLAPGAEIQIHIEATPNCPEFGGELLENQASVTAANEGAEQQTNNASEVVPVTVLACGE